MANLDTEVDGPDNTYIRRYLNDRVNNDASPVGEEVNLDTQPDSEYTIYIRRYLNDKEI